MNEEMKEPGAQKNNSETQGTTTKPEPALSNQTSAEQEAKKKAKL